MFYRGMDRAALDVAYNNTKAVTDFQTVFAGFQSRSAHFTRQRNVIETYATVIIPVSGSTWFVGAKMMHQP